MAGLHGGPGAVLARTLAATALPRTVLDMRGTFTCRSCGHDEWHDTGGRSQCRAPECECRDTGAFSAPDDPNGVETQRAGQAAFNALALSHPELADALRGSDEDPYYDDSRVVAFYLAVARLIRQ